MHTIAEDAIKLIRSNDHIFIHSAGAAPQQLIQALVQRASELKNISIYQMHTEGNAAYGDALYKDVFNVNCFFVGANLRASAQQGRAQYIPIFLSEIPALFRKKAIPLDVALIQVSPPDQHGFCSLGVSIDISLAAVQSAATIIAEINPNMPRTHGAGFIHISKINAAVPVNYSLPEIEAEASDAVTDAIARHVASIVEDGATLQMGIGKIPNAVLTLLKNHRQLGVHTEMLSDGIIGLIEAGVVTGELKKKHQHKVVTSFLLGTKRLYNYVNDNPLIQMLDIGYVNDTHVIRQNPRVTAINSAIEVDITGQVCADSIGPNIYSGVGGQMDFMRGAALSEGGKAIIAMPSTTNSCESKIVTMLRPGAGVVTTRAHVRFVVTEFGIADLYAKNLQQRAEALINIAHPDHRALLEKTAHHNVLV